MKSYSTIKTCRTVNAIFVATRVKFLRGLETTSGALISRKNELNHLSQVYRISILFFTVWIEVTCARPAVKSSSKSGTSETTKTDTQTKLILVMYVRKPLNRNELAKLIKPVSTKELTGKKFSTSFSPL